MSRKVEQLLSELGYKLDFSEGSTATCDLHRGEEHWLGKGASNDEALQDALHQACPSDLSWTLLQKALQKNGSSDRVRRESTPKIRTSSSKGPPRLVPKDASAPTVEAALEQLDILSDRVTDCREELGLFSPERQRHAMLAWICEARGHTDYFGHEAKVRDRVAAISRLLTDIGKSYWPGSVVALQLNMEPSELPRHVLGGSANTWSRAADLAETALSQIERADTRRGLDASGWADGAHLAPGPKHPGALMDQLVGEVEDVGGKLGRQAAARRLPEGPDYLRWVRTLRWLRGTGHRPELWSLLAGRFRWWASRRESSLEPGGKELDAAFRPGDPWAETLSDHPADDPSATRRMPPNLQRQLDGHKVLLVSPRWDRSVFDALGESLPRTDFSFSLAESERLGSAASDIEQGNYQVVVAGLGFQGRSADRKLATACAGTDVHYVRAPSADLAGYLRGLARATSPSD